MDILKIKDMWEKIKRLPYEREEVRYNILIEPVKKSGIGFDNKELIIFDENSFRKFGLRISGETVFFKNRPQGLLLDIIPAKEFLEGIKRKEKR
ncbi:hypothetical protein ES708_34378 [subsurface metagenome]